MRHIQLVNLARTAICAAQECLSPGPYAEGNASNIVKRRNTPNCKQSISGLQ